jgi:hypothetical protein
VHTRTELYKIRSAFHPEKEANNKDLRRRNDKENILDPEECRQCIGIVDGGVNRADD